MSGYVVRGNASKLPLPDESVDLIISSPPYFALRSYRDSGEHYTGQIGSEPTPQEWLEALWACMAEWWRVLKPTGSVFVNLGDKRTGSGGGNQSGLKGGYQGGGLNSFQSPTRYNQAAFGRAKSKMLLPHRFAIGCEDGLADPEGIGWIVRQDLIWQKLNGLPESVTDRHRDSHEFIFHLTKQERYFAAMDEIRESHEMALSYKRLGQENAAGVAAPRAVSRGDGDGRGYATVWSNPLGKLPGSVWPMASEPLIIPAWAREKFNLPDHFAAFPTELPRRLILAFSPSGICCVCGEGRKPVVEKRANGTPRTDHGMGARHTEAAAEMDAGNRIAATRSEWAMGVEATITGYACACGTENLPLTRPAVVLDPFSGTGTVPMVAKQLGRIGIGIDLSADYCRLAQWRIAHPPGKVMAKTWQERQGTLL